jgi:hypothetical protein
MGAVCSVGAVPAAQPVQRQPVTEHDVYVSTDSGETSALLALNLEFIGGQLGDPAGGR